MGARNLAAGFYSPHGILESPRKLVKKHFFLKKQTLPYPGDPRLGQGICIFTPWKGPDKAMKTEKRGHRDCGVVPILGAVTQSNRRSVVHRERASRMT